MVVDEELEVCRGCVGVLSRIYTRGATREVDEEEEEHEEEDECEEEDLCLMFKKLSFSPASPNCVHTVFILCCQHM